MADKPLCDRGDLRQARKFIWNVDRLTLGGIWLCAAHFEEALANGAVAWDGRFWEFVEPQPKKKA